MNGETEWTVATLKEHFEALLADRDAEIKKLTSHVDELVERIPREYGRKVDIEALETTINSIRADHIQRVELAELKDLHNRDISELKDVQAQGKGIRIAISAGMGVIVALVTVALGALYANQMTSGDVSGQIARESPWANDRPLVDSRINQLEKEVVVLRTQLATHEATDRLRASLTKKKG